MTWKAYAAVSGATVIAGWLAASPSNAPAPAASRAASPRAEPALATDIETQADRLHARLRAERSYAEPRRNPFRFAPRDETPPGAAVRPPADAEPDPFDDVAIQPAPQVTVSGIAEEQVDGRTVRTAVLSSPMGVLLVREGDDVLGFYRVGRIEGEAVELVRVEDGAVLRLALGAR